tara:strand:- start:2570 stop:2686 length:117 start_codon:yes stop_codon:yes gene_type:complete
LEAPRGTSLLKEVVTAAARAHFQQLRTEAAGVFANILD